MARVPFLRYVLSPLSSHAIMASLDWNNPTWLFAPGASVTDDIWDIRDTVGADYQEDRALRLFTTIEFRLACCITHFDDFSQDDRLVNSVRSELVRRVVLALIWLKKPTT